MFCFFGFLFLENSMGLGRDAVEVWGDGGKLKGSKGKKKSKKESGEGKEESGCWVTFRLMSSCMSSRSKVDTSISSAITHCGNLIEGLIVFD